MPKSNKYITSQFNLDRAAFAQAALKTFQDRTETEDGDAVCDLICDLMHLCRQQTKPYGDFATNLRRATNHFAAERHGEE